MSRVHLHALQSLICCSCSFCSLLSIVLLATRGFRSLRKENHERQTPSRRAIQDRAHAKNDRDAGSSMMSYALALVKTNAKREQPQKADSTKLIGFGMNMIITAEVLDDMIDLLVYIQQLAPEFLDNLNEGLGAFSFRAAFSHTNAEEAPVKNHSA